MVEPQPKKELSQPTFLQNNIRASLLVTSPFLCNPPIERARNTDMDASGKGIATIDDQLTTVGTDPLVSVVIPHYNDLEALRVCVAGLHRQTWPASRMEIIVADNNSACGLEAVREAAPDCRIVHAPIQGAGPARNAGVRASRGEILAFIDSDCDPRPNWVENGVRALSSFDFAGGHVETSPRDPLNITPVEAWEMVFGFDFERYILVEGYTGSGNMWVWRRVFDAVGGFRAGIAEDMDWSFRATAAGFRLGYQQDAVVRHLARTTWADLTTRWRRVLFEHYALAREKRLGLLRWAARTISMPLSIAPHLGRVFSSDRLPDWRTKAGAASVLVAHRMWRTCIMAQLPFARIGNARGPV
jgi:GT2 family glycosyltransferase